MKRSIIIVGPTAAGKTDVSIRLARRFHGEIISADSMQVYRGLSIGTAKIDRAAVPDVPHHLIDICDPSEEFSVHDFRSRAVSIMDAVHARRMLPFVVGGSGLYIKALVDGLAPHPGSSEPVRARLRERAKAAGLRILYDELQRVDPVSARAVKPTDERRIIRALEIFEQSGVTATDWKKKTEPLSASGFEALMLGVTWDRSVLYERTGERVDEMIRQGLVDEVKVLAGRAVSKTTQQAVGYKELLAHLRGEISFDEAVTLIKQNTRHLVKKQFTWFRRDNRIEWFTLAADADIPAVTERMAARIEAWLGTGNGK